MRILACVLAVVLAVSVAYDVKSGATPAPASRAGDTWFVTVDEADGSVSLAREDFDAIVTAYNQQRAELGQLRRVGGCP
jgi:hypothetical protein